MQTARDIAIIVLAAITVVAFALFVWLISVLRSFLRTLREDLKPILASGEETLRAASGLLNLIRDSLSGPLEGVFRFKGKSSWILRILRMLGRMRRKKR